MPSNPQYIGLMRLACESQLLRCIDNNCPDCDEGKYARSFLAAFKGRSFTTQAELDEAFEKWMATAED